MGSLGNGEFWRLRFVGMVSSGDGEFSRLRFQDFISGGDWELSRWVVFHEMGHSGDG